jgi:hypothetical protein
MMYRCRYSAPACAASVAGAWEPTLGRIGKKSLGRVYLARRDIGSERQTHFRQFRTLKEFPGIVGLTLRPILPAWVEIYLNFTICQTIAPVWAKGPLPSAACRALAQCRN